MSVKYLQEPFVNEFGQTIAVGQKIIAVKQGYNHSVSIDEGVYLGLRRDRDGKVRNVTVLLNVARHGYFLPDGTLAKNANVVGAEWRKGTTPSRATLPRKRIYPTT